MATDHWIYADGRCSYGERCCAALSASPALDVKRLHVALTVAFAKPYEYRNGHLTGVLHDDAAERIAAEYDRLGESSK